MSDMETHKEEQQDEHHAMPQESLPEAPAADPQPVPENAASGSGELSLGQQLAQQREALGYSVEFVANHLKLSPRKIQQMESGDWTAFPSGPFISGFIRNYARLLQLDGDALVTLLPGAISNRPTQAAEVFQGSAFRSASGYMPQEGGSNLWRNLAIAAGVLVAAAIILLFVLPEDAGQRLRDWTAELNQVQSAAQEPVLTPVPVGPEVPPVSQTVQPPAPLQTTPLPQPIPSAPVAVAPSPVQQPLPAPSAAVPVAVGQGAAMLRLKFLGESWVEIKQADGQTIFGQLNQANTEQVVSGTPPFTLKIGSASQVQLDYKGKRVDLKPYTREDVARITLE